MLEREKVTDRIRNRFVREITDLYTRLGEKKSARKYAQSFERSTHIKCDSVKEYTQVIRKCIRLLEFKLGNISSSNPSPIMSTTPSVDLVYLVAASQIYSALQGIQSQNLTLSKMAMELLTDTTRPISAIISSQEARLKRILALDSIVSSQYKRVLASHLIEVVIAVLRSWAVEGYRPFFMPLHNEHKIIIPADVLFIPKEKMKVICRDDVEFDGFFNDNRLFYQSRSGAENLKKSNRTVMKFNMVLFPCITGSGRDDVGEFILRSRSAVTNPDRIRFIKEYSTHEVYYVGSMSGGLISGIWSLPGDSVTGSFAVWPKRYDEFLELSMAPVNAPSGRVNQIMNRLLYLDFGDFNEEIDYFVLGKTETVCIVGSNSTEVLHDSTMNNLSKITVICYFNQHYQGHLQYLKHFDYLHYDHFDEKREERINLDLVDAQDLSDLISYKMHSRIELQNRDGEHLLELFGTAVYLIEHDVLDLIVAQLIKRADNIKFVLQLFLIRQDYDLPTFNFEPILKYIDYHFETICSSREWLDFTFHAVRQTLNRRTLRVRSEKTIILAIRNWVSYNYPAKYDDVESYDVRVQTIKELSKYICEPSHNYFARTWFTKHNILHLWPRKECPYWEWLKNEVGDELDSRKRFSLRHHYDDAETVYMICENDNGAFITTVQHIPYTGKAGMVCHIPIDRNPGSAGHVAPIYDEHFGTLLLLFGGKLNLETRLYCVSLQRWFQLPDAPRPIDRAGILASEGCVFVVAGYGKYSHGDFPKDKITNRKDILQLQLTVDETSFEPFNTSIWKSFECTDVARLYQRDPAHPICLAMLTSMTFLYEENRKISIKRKYSVSSNNLIIMGSGEDMLFLALDNQNMILSQKLSDDKDVMTSHMSYDKFYYLYHSQNSETDVHVVRSTSLSNIANHLKVAGALPMDAICLQENLPSNAVVMAGVSQDGEKCIHWFDPERSERVMNILTE